MSVQTAKQFSEFTDPNLEILYSTEEIAARVAARLQCDVQFVGVAPDNPAPDVLLANTARLHEVLPYDAMPLDTLCDWAADWVQAGNHTLSTPTKFDVRDGKY